MLRKLFLISLAFCLLFSSLALAENGFSEEEADVDITEWFQLPEEERVKDKKDSDGAYLMTVSFTGDLTIGGDNYHNKTDFYKALKKHDDDINFIMKNVRDIFLDDDLTVVNFEGTLTDTKYVPSDKKSNDFLFNISPSYVSVLPDNGVEAVSLDNNHVYDHGTEGFNDTVEALDGAGVLYSTPTHMAVYNFKDMADVALLAFNCIDRYGTGFQRSRFADQYSAEFLNHDTFEEAVCDEIAKAKEIYSLVIVSFHWGNEAVYIPTDNQIRLGRMAVDAGADLVVGHHPHRLQPIEYYHGKYIVYSLGNFCFAGHNNPKDKSSMIFQARFRVKNSEVSFKDFRIIPIRISQDTKVNDYVPYVFEDGYERDSVLLTLSNRDNIKKLDYAITEFPLEFK